MAADKASRTPLLWVEGGVEAKLFGLTPQQRLERQFARFGVLPLPALQGVERLPSVIVVSGAAAIDQPLVQLLATGAPVILLDDSGKKVLAIRCSGSEAPTALKIVAGSLPPAALAIPAAPPSGLKADFWKALRKKETPYALSISAADAGSAEWRIFMGTYKGATDLVTKHLWPVPAFHATRLLAPLGVTPNMVTSIGAVMTGLAFWLFLQGHFGAGLLAAWAMTFLDTVDGKLARTTLTSSKWGDVFDHGIDLVHPPFWYIAWAVGLGHAGILWSSQMFWWTNGLILGGYILQRLMEGIAIKWLGLEIHIWRPVDTFFRQITARRNPNLILLTLGALLSRPDLGLIAVAAWTVICLVLHGLQLAQGLAARRQGELVSWMTRP